MIQAINVNTIINQDDKYEPYLASCDDSFYIVKLLNEDQIKLTCLQKTSDGLEAGDYRIYRINQFKDMKVIRFDSITLFDRRR